MSSRKSSRISRKPERFDPSSEKWIPGSANGKSNPGKIDHWQLRFDGSLPESRSERDSDENYEEKIVTKMKSDIFSEKDHAFINDSKLYEETDFHEEDESSDSEFETDYETDYETDEEYESSCSWCDDDTDEDE